MGFGDGAVVVVVVVVVVVACSQLSRTAEPNSVFESIWTSENNLESSPKNIAREF